MLDAVEVIDHVREPARLTALRQLALLDTPIEPAFDRLTRLAARILDAPVSLVTLVDHDRQFFKSCVGLAEPWASRRETPLSHSFCQYTLASRAPLVISDARAHPLLYENLAILDLNVVAYAGMPLITSDGHVLGSFCVIDSQPRVWTENELDTVRELAASVMTEIELRAQIVERERAEQALYQANAELETRVRARTADLEAANRQLHQFTLDVAAAYDATLEGWVGFLDLRDRETEGHTQRVTVLTDRLAALMGLDAPTREQVRRGALLHDIGKMGIPDAILHKPGPLTEAEWEVMRLHPVYAYELLAPIAFLRPALDIPYCHHEQWDGSGYPRGLRGTDIPLAARIFAVVDVWDALRSDRPYRNGWPAACVREHIMHLSGSHFDPAVVERFLSLALER